ncbi:MAG: hybrid sensor histidine kinase/response regulator [Gemmatimonadota bacterium]|nr:hybrid sensor histidine kinase/response regulator [Gemmatimonadota bacterium]
MHATEETGAAPSRAAILLVDDRPENLLSLEATLEVLGCELVRAASGEEALRQVLSRDFTLILMDVQMPGMDGFETTRHIKARERSQHVPVIFLTAIDEGPGHLAAGYGAGAVDFLYKPFQPEILRAKVRVFLELEAKRGEVERLAREAERREAERREEAARRELAVRAAEERQILLLRERAARQEAEAANRSKSEFLAVMSHELRTPINAIMGYTELLDMGIAGPVTEAQRAQLARVRASSEHLLGLINEILDLAKVESGRMQVRRDPARVAAVVGSALALAGPQADRRGIRIDDQCGADGNTYFLGDEDRVRQVLVNVIGNAVKFTDPGGRITITCGELDAADSPVQPATGGPLTYIRVADTGIGIVPEDLERVFQPFVQADQGHTRAHEGTGLGLSISRELARLMGGDLTAESEVGVGSTFTLWLPAGRAGEAEAIPAWVEGLPRGLAEAGEAILREADRILERYEERMRRDPRIPMAHGLGEADLWDHQASFVSDLASSLIGLTRSKEIPPERLLRDGSEIQRVISERHGQQRAQLGWTEDALRREYQILLEEVEAGIRQGLEPGSDADVESALEVLRYYIRCAAAAAVGTLTAT